MIQAKLVHINTCFQTFVSITNFCLMYIRSFIWLIVCDRLSPWTLKPYFLASIASNLACGSRSKWWSVAFHVRGMELLLKSFMQGFVDSFWEVFVNEGLVTSHSCKQPILKPFKTLECFPFTSKRNCGALYRSIFHRKVFIPSFSLFALWRKTLFSEDSFH